MSYLNPTAEELRRFSRIAPGKRYLDGCQFCGTDGGRPQLDEDGVDRRRWDHGACYFEHQRLVDGGSTRELPTGAQQSLFGGAA